MKLYGEDYVGARFLKCDLQMHTPADPHWVGENPLPSDPTEDNYREAADKAESQFQVEMYTISAVRNFHKSGRSEIALKLITNMLDDDKVSFETKNSAEYLKSIISTEKG